MKTHPKPRLDETLAPELILLTLFCFLSIVVLISALVQESNYKQSDEYRIGLSLKSDVDSTLVRVEDFLAENPNATDVFDVIPQVSGSNGVAVFGTPADYIICAYNAEGSPNWYKYSSAMDWLKSGNGSEAGLCGEPNQKNIISEKPRFLEGDAPATPQH